MKFYHLLLMPVLIMCACTILEKQEESPIYTASDFTPENEFTSGIEGPATDKDGFIYAVNFEKQGTIGKVSPGGESSLFVELPEGSIGNGIRIDAQGMLYIADYTRHNVLKIDPQTRKITVHAHDSMMNQPNDLAIMKSGVLFASDPNWKASTGQIWRIDLDGTTTLLADSMSTTNGIEVSPDEKTLYVNESVSRKVWAFDLSPSGDISNKRLLIEFPDFGMDGMRCDAKGNLYITRYDKGAVAIISPEGKLIREVILKGKKPSNITFGGPDGKSCFMTLHDRGCFESFRTEIPGRSWQMRQGN